MAKMTKEEALAVLQQADQQESQDGIWLNLSKSGNGVYIRVDKKCYATTTARVKLLLAGTLKDKKGKIQTGVFLGLMPEKENKD